MKRIDPGKGRRKLLLRNERLWLLAIFLLALTVRLIYLSQIKTNPFFHHPIVDCRTYDSMAVRIAAGDWVGNEVFFQAPLYPYFLALIYRIFGHDYYIARLIQLILGSLSCVLVYLVAKRVFNSVVAIIASVILATYSLLFFFEGELLSPVLLVFLNLSLILLLLRAREKPTSSRWFVAGIIAGLSTVAKATILLFLPFVVLWVWLVFRGREPNRRLFSHALTFFVGTALIVSIVTIRNYIVGRDLVFVSSNAGINFCVGNNPNYDQTVGIGPGMEWQSLGQMPQLLGIRKPSQQSRFFFSKAWESIRREPLRWFRSLLKKLYIFWNGDEIMRNQEIYPFRRYSSLLRTLLWKRKIAYPFGVLAPLALTGIIISLRLNRREKTLLPLFFIAAHTVSIILFFVCSRYRVPLIPFLAIFGGYTLYWWTGRIRARQYRHLVLSSLPFLVFFGVANLRIGKMAMTDNADAYWSLGASYYRNGQSDKAVESFQKALELKPNCMEALHNLGIIHMRKGELSLAQEEFRRVLTMYPLDVYAHINLANVYFEKGLLDSAISEYKFALRLNPDNSDARRNLRIAYGLVAERGSDVRLDSLDLRIEQLERTLNLNPESPELHNSLGNAYRKKGWVDLAMIRFLRALRLNPGYAIAHNNLGAIYADKKEYSKAKMEWERTLELDPNNVAARNNLSKLKEMGY